jgi:hypothetical protein
MRKIWKILPRRPKSESLGGIHTESRIIQSDPERKPFDSMELDASGSQ